MDFTWFLGLILVLLFMDTLVARIFAYKLAKNTRTYKEEHYPDKTSK